MPLIHSKAVYYHNQFLSEADQELEISIHGEELFEYYLTWALKNVITVHVWSKRVHLDTLSDERREDFRVWSYYKIKIGNQWFYILVPKFMHIYIRENNGNSNIKRVVLIHDRCQKFTKILTSPTKIFNAPQKPNFSVDIIKGATDEDAKVIVRNRNGRIFFTVKGLLNLLLYCSHGLSDWIDIVKIKKIDKKRDKKEK